jgi:hypothetical protein
MTLAVVQLFCRCCEGGNLLLLHKDEIPCVYPHRSTSESRIYVSKMLCATTVGADYLCWSARVLLS